MVNRHGGLHIGIACCAVTLFLAGCGLMRHARKVTYAPQNAAGEEMAGSVKSATMAAEKVLQDRGYRTSMKHFSRGPGFNAACRVESYREQREGLKSVGTQLAGSMALGLLGVRSDVKTSTAEVVIIEVSQKWDETTWDRAEPRRVIVNVWGGSCERTMNNEYKNCQKFNGFDMDGVRKEMEPFITQIESRSGGPGTASPQAAAAPSPSAANSTGEAEYQTAVAAYNAANYDEAWRQSYAALQANPSHWQAWQMIGNCQYAKGDKTSAITSYNNSLQLHPDNPTLRSFVAQLQAQ